MWGVPLLLVVLSLTLLACEEILIGQTAALTGTQGFFGTSYSVGLNASFQEANDAGGIASRPLRLIVLDDGYNVTQGRENVMQLLDVHKVLMLAGVYGTAIAFDPQVASRIAAGNIPYVGACSGAVHNPFRRQFVNVRASYFDETMVMAWFVLRTLRLRWGAILYQNDPVGVGSLEYIKAAWGPVGVTMVARGFHTPGKLDVEGALELILGSAIKPQVIAFGTTEYPSLKFIRMYYSDPRANPECIMMLFSMDLTMTFHTQIPAVYWKNILFTSVMPVPDGSPMKVVRHFSQVLSKYYPAATPDHVMLEGYVTGRLIVDTLRGIPGADVTRDLFLSQIYTRRLFMVEDLSIGLYADNFSGCESLLCSCNSGHRSVYIVRLNLTSGLPVSDPMLPKFTFPITSCFSDPSSLRAPILFGQLVPTGPAALTSLAEEVRAGIVAAFADINAGDPIPGRPFEIVPVVYTTDPSAAAATLVDRYPILALLGSVVPHSPSLNVTVPRIGTIDVEATCPSPAFDATDFRVQPGIELELMALVNFAVQAVCPLHFRAPDTPAGRSVLETLVKSVNTLQQVPASSLVYSDVWEVLMGVSTGCLVLVAGATDVGVVLNSLATLPALSLLTTSAIAMQLATDANVSQLPEARRLFFPSAAVGGTAWPVGGNRSEAWRYGYLAAQVAIQGMQHSRFANQKYNTPVQMLQALNTVKAMAFERITLGPYFGQVCMSPGDENCECNAGVHTVSILRGLANISDMEVLYTITGCTVAYEPLALLPGTPGGIPWATMIGAIVGAFTGLGLLLALAVAVGRRSHSAAPKDPRRPFCILFTDIQASTHLWATQPEEMAAALNTHHSLIRKLIAKYHCYEVKTIGDSFMCAAKTPAEAVRLALGVQTAFFEHDWGTTVLDRMYQAFVSSNRTESQSPWNGLRVRIGIHYGMGDIQFDPVAKSYDYYGMVVNAAARIESAAHGGQIVISHTVYEAISGLHLPLVCTNLGAHHLRGLAEPLQLYQVLPDGLLSRRTFPPLRSDVEAESDSDSLTNVCVPLCSPSCSHSTKSSMSAVEVEMRWADNHPLVAKGDITAEDLKCHYEVAMATLRTLLVMQTKRGKEMFLSSLCERLHVHNYGNEGAPLQRTLQNVVHRVLPVMVGQHGLRVLSPKVRALVFHGSGSRLHITPRGRQSQPPNNSNPLEEI